MQKRAGSVLNGQRQPYTAFALLQAGKVTLSYIRSVRKRARKTNYRQCIVSISRYQNKWKLTSIGVKTCVKKKKEQYILYCLYLEDSCYSLMP